MKPNRHSCFHFRLIWLPLLYTYLLTTLSYADHLLGDQDFDDPDDNPLPNRRWNFYPQHRYDIKKPGPTYFLHEPDSKELKDLQLNNVDSVLRPEYTEGAIQWVPMDETSKLNNFPDEMVPINEEKIETKPFPQLEAQPSETEEEGDKAVPLLALLDNVSRLLSSSAGSRDEPLAMEPVKDDNVEKEYLPVDQLTINPNLWSAYSDNRFEVEEPSYLFSVNDFNEYLRDGDNFVSDNVQRPILPVNALTLGSVPDESGSNRPIDSQPFEPVQEPPEPQPQTDNLNPDSEINDESYGSDTEARTRANLNELTETRDGASSSVDKHETIDSIPLDPTKLIIPKELNLVFPESKVKRHVATSGHGYGSDIETGPGQSLTVLTISLCLTVFAALIAGLVAFVVKRNQNLRHKLRTLIGSIGSAEEGAEAASDYEDLCRQRMQGKNHKKSDKDENKSPGSKSKSGSLRDMITRTSDSKQQGKSENRSSDSGPEPSPPSRSSTSSWSEEPITSNLDISTGHMILSYMEDHLKNKDRLAKEWEALCAYEVDPCSTTAALLPPNLSKNRFPDILPFDHSRVILNDLANPNRSDYINASTITDHDPRSPVYIVTQGPLPSTVADFWQMVWEQGSVIIVMLTRLLENGVASSARYWPEEGSALHANFEVHLVSEHIWCDDYLVRSIFLKNVKTNETRTVTQFHYLSWSENGVPPNPRSLLEFRRKVNKSYRGRSCPIVVHCSDGIGRTGTYCLIDMVLNRLAKGAKEIDIAATLEHIRDQRGGSVKSKAQFEFVLEAIAEEVSAILKTLKPN